MMIDFVYQNPTKIIFGKGSIEKLSAEILQYGTHVLLVYGGQSTKNSGLYDCIIQQLERHAIEYDELPFVTIPSLDRVYEGIHIVKEKKIDVIVGIGGGTCIDVAKSIAVGGANCLDIWDVLTGKIPYDGLDCLPIGCVVTIPGSGSEMDGNSEIDDIDVGVHGSIGSFMKTYPRFSILDPYLTYDIPYSLTLYHGVTILVQAMEQYLSHTDHTPIQDGLTEAILKTVLSSLERLKHDLHDEDARAQLMYASALTTSRLLTRGKQAAWLGGPLGDLIEEKLGLTYSQGIAITWPKYLLTCYQEYISTLKSFALNVMSVDPTDKSCDEIAYEGVQAFQKKLLELGVADTILDLHKEPFDIYEIEDQINHLASRQVISKENIQKVIKLSLGG